IVVACNTASAIALPHLQETLSVPVIGVIQPGAAAAASATKNGHVGVIGTRATIKSCAYETALHAVNNNLRVIARACPVLVPLIEEGWLRDDVTDRAIARYLAPLVDSGIDTLVLGCTHYPLLRDDFSQFLGSEVNLVDSAQNSARDGTHVLAEKEIAATTPTRTAKLTVALT